MNEKMWKKMNEMSKMWKSDKLHYTNIYKTISTWKMESKNGAPPPPPPN